MAISTIGTSGIADANITTAKLADANVTTAKLAASSALVGKAYNINGQFQVDQRASNVRTGLGGANVYVADMWKLNWSTTIAARYTYSTEANGGVNGESQWAKWLCTTADASLAAGDFHYFFTPMEAQSLQGLIDINGKLGDTCQTQEILVHADGASSITFPCTVGCWLTSQDGTQRGWVADVTIPAADTWYRLSIPRTADTVATIDNNSGSGLWMGFSLATGTDRQSTGGVWENWVGGQGTAASINVSDAVNNYIGIANVKLEKGLVDTGIEHEDIAYTRLLCNRRFLRYSVANSESMASGFVRSSTEAEFIQPFPVPMASPPARSVSDATALNVRHAATNTAGVTITNLSVSPLSSSFRVNVASGLTTGHGCLLFGTGAVTIDYSAEV